MKKFCQPFFFIFLFSFFSIISFCQELKPVRFSNGDFRTDNNIVKQSFSKEKLQSSVYGKNYYVLIQFSSIPSLQFQRQLKELGVELHSYLPGNAYLASIKNDFDFLSAKKFNITSINVVPSDYKIDPALQNYKQSYDKENLMLVAVNFHSGLDKNIVIQELKKRGAIVVGTKLKPVNTVFIQPNPGIIASIAALPFVNYISLQSMTDKPLNYNDVATHGISALEAPNGKNLYGRGVTLGIGDNADISTHVDFTGRLISRTPWYPDMHGTHVAGTAAGAGIIDIKNHGMAPKATIIDQYFSDIITQAAAYLSDFDMVLTNNSYYSDQAGCPGEGAYDNLSNYADWQINGNYNLLHVIAAGNDGSLSCSPFTAPYGTIKSGWQCAKDVLTVGAISAFNDAITNFSSSGPVNDGRIKPEIVCAGYNVLSTIQNNGYGLDAGTSMAAPVATGSLALMYERYRQLHNGVDPYSALMKAILCNTAEDMGNPGPDYNYGFGMLNARRAVQAIDSNWYFVDSIINGTNANKTIIVPQNASVLKVMLYWADPAAAINAATTLVNDLDLTVTEPSSLLHHPLILNPAPPNVTNTAIEGPDHTNNIEQVVIYNPVAGSYTANVSGYSVPVGTQVYSLTYEIIDSSVTVEYPYGGETWVAGDSEYIRWSAYGSNTNNFTIQYSIDSGNTWTTINNNVPASSRLYLWTVPSVITNNALIRITANGTNLAGVSTFAFTILGRPVVTATNLCQGYVQLNWGSIPGASSYDVMQLAGDSMQVISNTTDTFFLVKGLNKYQTYWFGVRAKNAAVAGRRSLSVSAIPNGGACTATMFNNDLTIDSVLQPNTARQFFSNASNATQPVTIQIRNLGSIPVTGPFNVSYTCPGGSATEIVNTTVPAGGTIIYSFVTPYVSNPSGFHYNFQVWVTNAADSNHQNDTAYKTVNLLANPVILYLPVTESFETTDSAAYTSNVSGLNGNDAFDFSSNTSNGRLRTFVDTGFAHTGKQAATLDQTPYEAYYTSDSLTQTYNLSNYTSAQLRYDFYYKSQGQVDSPGNVVWMRGSQNDAWIQVYNLYTNQAGLGLWQHGLININSVLNTAVPAQTVSSTFQVRFGEEGFTSANSPLPEISGLDNGFTFDDLTLSQALNDIGISGIISPANNGCALTSATPVTVQLTNYNNFIANNVLVNYQINQGTIITDTISIAPDTTINYTFNKTANLSSYTDYSINVWVQFTGDTYSANDSILNYPVHNSPLINTYPYLQGFETNNGYFYAKGINSSWQWGTPAKDVINKAANGNYAWVTNLTGNYNDNELSYLYSPCFDLSSLVQPELSFSDIYQVESGYDFTWVEYSTDGINWQKLGTSGQGTNWYNDSVGEDWTGISTSIWHVASFDIPTTASSVRFRFVLKSDQGVNYDGVGIDDIHIFEKAPVYTGVPITSMTQNVSGNNWINFSSGGGSIVSINPNGNNLGTTNVEVYPYSGPPRFSNNQYYLNRNIVVQPSNQPTSYVSVRFYFTDSEANSLINDSVGCANCARPTDAYSLGVTKYSGSVSDENGTLADDLTGQFLFIPRDSTYIAPNDNGYYSEFEVNSFSEFWLNSGGVNGTDPLPLSLISFTAGKINLSAFVQWATENELTTYQYNIQRSTDGINYTSIGTMGAKDQSGPNQYSFIDSFPFPGINYYRIQIIDRSGTMVYSPVRKVDFSNNANGFIVYPNPVTESKLFIASFDNCYSAVLSDASGKLVRSYKLSGKNNTLDISGVARGVYELKIFSTTSTNTQKILVQ